MFFSFYHVNFEVTKSSLKKTLQQKCDIRSNATQQYSCTPLSTVCITSLVLRFLFVFHVCLLPWFFRLFLLLRNQRTGAKGAHPHNVWNNTSPVVSQKRPEVSLLCLFWMWDSTADCVRRWHFSLQTFSSLCEETDWSWRVYGGSSSRRLEGIFTVNQITAALWQQPQSASIKTLHPGAWRAAAQSELVSSRNAVTLRRRQKRKRVCSQEFSFLVWEQPEMRMAMLVHQSNTDILTASG